jgi:hypothetical protein
MNSGSLKQKRKMRSGACRPRGSEGMGRKGAMPEPVLLLEGVASRDEMHRNRD